jgi:hypothetical protein
MDSLGGVGFSMIAIRVGDEFMNLFILLLHNEPNGLAACIMSTCTSIFLLVLEDYRDLASLQL